MPSFSVQICQQLRLRREIDLNRLFRLNVPAFSSPHAKCTLAPPVESLLLYFGVAVIAKYSAIKAERRAIMIQSFVRMRVVYVSLPACRLTCFISPHPPNRVGLRSLSCTLYFSSRTLLLSFGTHVAYSFGKLVHASFFFLAFDLRPSETYDCASLGRVPVDRERPYPKGELDTGIEYITLGARLAISNQQQHERQAQGLHSLYCIDTCQLQRHTRLRVHVYVDIERFPGSSLPSLVRSGSEDGQSPKNERWSCRSEPRTACRWGTPSVASATLTSFSPSWRAASKSELSLNFPGFRGLKAQRGWLGCELEGRWRV